MSTKYPVEFKSLEDRFPLPEEVYRLVVELHSVIDGNYQWPSDQIDFVFRGIATRQSFGFTVLTFFTQRIGVRRDLLPHEKRMIDLCQDIINKSSGKQQIKNAFSLLFELHVLNEKRIRFGAIAMHRSSLYVNGAEVRHNGYKEIDIAVDALDSKNHLQMCECTLGLSDFAYKKDDQVSFYAEAFFRIRQVTQEGTSLRLELFAANSWGFPLNQLYFSAGGRLKEANVDVIVRSLHPPYEESI